MSPVFLMREVIVPRISSLILDLQTGQVCSKIDYKENRF